MREPARCQGRPMAPRRGTDRLVRRCSSGPRVWVRILSAVAILIEYSRGQLWCDAIYSPARKWFRNLPRAFAVCHTLLVAFWANIPTAPLAKPATHFALVFEVKPAAMRFPGANRVACWAAQSVAQPNQAAEVPELVYEYVHAGTCRMPSPPAGPKRGKSSAMPPSASNSVRRSHEP